MIIKSVAIYIAPFPQDKQRFDIPSVGQSLSLITYKLPSSDSSLIHMVSE